MLYIIYNIYQDIFRYIKIYIWIYKKMAQNIIHIVFFHQFEVEGKEL